MLNLAIWRKYNTFSPIFFPHWPINPLTYVIFFIFCLKSFALVAISTLGTTLFIRLIASGTTLCGNWNFFNNRKPFAIILSAISIFLCRSSFVAVLSSRSETSIPRGESRSFLEYRCRRQGMRWLCVTAEHWALIPAETCLQWRARWIGEEPQRRCSPNRHCVSVQSSGNWCSALSLLCTHIAAGTEPSLMSWPVRGLQGIIFLPDAASVPDVEVLDCG